ncbi:hypothetical protein E2K59_23795, partial [Escherichia coli]
MCRYHTTKDFCRFTVVQHCLQFRARFGVIFRQFAGDKHLHTLDTNWRSAPGMVNSVNKLFSQTDDAFMFREIPFIPVKSAG